MTDPLHPSRSFAEIIAAGLPADIETAHCDRQAVPDERRPDDQREAPVMDARVREVRAR